MPNWRISDKSSILLRSLIVERGSVMAALLSIFFLLALMSAWRISSGARPPGSLRPHYYLWTYLQAEAIVFAGVQRVVAQEARMVASLLCLHFHECFVNECDGSVLLDDTATFEGEKTSGPNLNSSHGFEVIDYIKEELESACPAQVSCADILAMAARDSVVLTRGPYWEVPLGRRDSLTSSKAAVAKSLPAPTSNISKLNSKFKDVGLTENDLVPIQ